MRFAVQHNFNPFLDGARSKKIKKSIPLEKKRKGAKMQPFLFPVNFEDLVCQTFEEIDIASYNEIWGDADGDFLISQTEAKEEEEAIG